MRVMIKFALPVESSNAAIRTGKLEKMFRQIAEDLKPEAAYFFSQAGERGGFYIVEMQESSQIADMAERFFFGLNAKVEFVTVMSAPDLEKGLSGVQNNIVLATSPTLTTPSLGVATGTSLALGGATIGSNALAVTGTALLSPATNTTALTISGGTVTASSPLLLLSQTWNNASATFQGIQFDVVPTAYSVGSNAQGSDWLYFTQNGVTNFEVGLGTGGNPYTYITGSVGVGNGPGYFAGLTGDEQSRAVLEVNVNSQGQLAFSGGTGNYDWTLYRSSSGVAQLNGIISGQNSSGGITFLHIYDTAANNLGRITFTATNGNPALVANTSKGWTFYTDNASTRALDILSAGNVGIGVATPSQLLTIASTGAMAWDNGSGTADAMFSRSAPATLHMGAADAASPVAQTLGVQSVVAGNGNTAGATWTLRGSLSNGSGGGDIIIQTTLSTAASGTQNTAATALTLKGGTQAAIFGSTFQSNPYTVGTLPAAGTAGRRAHVTDATSFPAFGGSLTGGGSTVVPVFDNGSAWVAG